MKNILSLCLVLLLAACKKDNKTFSLKTIKLSDYRKTYLLPQKLYLEVFDGNSSTAIAHTDPYPSELTLPATFIVHPNVPMTLYNKKYKIQLWGDVSGYISGCQINMDEYKIIFPIDMEVESDSLTVSIAGSWE